MWWWLLLLPVAVETEAQWIEAPALHAVEVQMLAEVNASRVHLGRDALIPDMVLVRESRRHAFWMARNQSMTHGHGRAENIAMGQRTARGVQVDWMNSSGHRSNILGGHTHFGGSVCRSRGGTLYWCQRFRRWR